MAVMVPPSGGNNQFTSASLYVGDLHPDVTEAMLYEIFNSVGPVASIRVCRDSLSRRSLGYAYVNYHSIGDAERALDTLNYTDIKGNAARIMWSHRDPSLRKSGAGNIFVKNLDKTIDNKALYDTFSLFGSILSCKVAADECGRSKSYGFVHYETEASAKQAIERVNGMQIGGKTVYVAPFIRRTDRSSTTDVKFTNIYIKNIPVAWDEDKIRGLFDKYGIITSMAIKTDSKNRNFAFINYEDADSARQAVEAMNNKMTNDEGIKEEDPGAPTSSEDEKEDDTNRLYVSRHQAKSQRQAMLKAKFDTSQDTKQRHQGVNLFIKNLADTVDDEKLREAFEPFGTITSAKVMRDSQDLSRGFGFVCFLSPDEATKAVTEMHLKLMYGKPLYVGLAEKREKRMARLQQRYRVPNMRPGMQANVPPQMQFAAPQQMYFGAPSQMPPPRPMMSYQPGVMPWRPQTPRPYGQQGGMPPQMNPMGMYPQPGMHPMANAGPHNMQMGGMMNRGGPRVNTRGATMHSLNGPKQATPMNKQVGGSSFKFTPQARNRIDHPGGGMHPGHPGGHAGQNAVGQDPNGPLGNPDTPLTAAALAAAPPNIQKQMLGEKLFPLIARYQPDLAGKITGMMLEMDNSELLILLESEPQLKAKVDEALRVLQQAQHD
eukprot:GHVS01066082.1.p1 GENE.GHVS01066082.1~~GHVS01066082.1.p1  ORF type:complete len:658 (+),score=91.49 GHVS01066082.1:106-2079(+)